MWGRHLSLPMDFVRIIVDDIIALAVYFVVLPQCSFDMFSLVFFTEIVWLQIR